jgi:hypothetical protein
MSPTTATPVGRVGGVRVRVEDQQGTQPGVGVLPPAQRRVVVDVLRRVGPAKWDIYG